jgi:hypothetical protein
MSVLRLILTLSSADTRCLTGYLPDELPAIPPPAMAERPIWLGYRGRKLPVW